MAIITVSSSVFGKLAVTTNSAGVSSLALLKDLTPVDIQISDVYTATYTRFFFVNNGLTTYAGFIKPTDAGRWIGLNEPTLKDYSSKVVFDGDKNSIPMAACPANNTLALVSNGADEFLVQGPFVRDVDLELNEYTANRSTMIAEFGVNTKTTHPTASRVKKLNGQLTMEMTYISGSANVDSQTLGSLILNHLNFKEFLAI